MRESNLSKRNSFEPGQIKSYKQTIFFSIMGDFKERRNIRTFLQNAEEINRVNAYMNENFIFSFF